MAKQQITPTRRTMLGFIVAAPVAGFAVPLLAAAPDLVRQFNDFDELTARMNNGRYSQAAWGAWEVRSQELYAAAEALPTTPENARVKARAVMSMYLGNEGDLLEDDQSTSGALMRQIITALGAH